MRILHVISGIPPKSGGPTRSVKGLCRGLALAGVDVSLLVLHGNDEFDNPCGVNVVYEKVPDIKSFDLVHLHGLWDPGLHKVVKACRKKDVKYVISPRGMLDPWALSVKRWKKIIALWLYQRRDLLKAAAFHATAQAEAIHINDAGFKKPCIIAPNAVDIPKDLPARKIKSDVRTAIFLSRLHPGKGLLTLAEAWARVKPEGWRMLVVGPDSYGHKKEVISKIEELGIADQWEFREAMDDTEKWVAYRSADLLVHPSVSENFGITIAEGLAAELPVITTKGTPWKELETHKCGWWIDIGVAPLASAITEATEQEDDKLREIGKRGRKLVEDKYTWDAVCSTLINGYKELLNG